MNKTRKIPLAITKPMSEPGKPTPAQAIAELEHRLRTLDHDIAMVAVSSHSETHKRLTRNGIDWEKGAVKLAITALKKL